MAGVPFLLLVLFGLLSFMCCATLNTQKKIPGGKLTFKEYAPSEKHTASVIFLHGLGDSGDGWFKIGSTLKLPWVKFMFPNAPERPVTINRGHIMPAWYDIIGMSEDSPEDGAGIRATSESVAQLISRETIQFGIPPDRIVLAGFSQGAVITLYTALTIPLRLGGAIALSGYMPLVDTLDSEFNPKSSSSPSSMVGIDGEGVQTTETGSAGSPPPTHIPPATPFLLCHGTSDTVVPLQMGQRASQLLSNWGADVILQEFAGLPHGTNTAEMRRVRLFLLKHLPRENT